jgi:hypothetical protein
MADLMGAIDRVRDISSEAYRRKALTDFHYLVGI